MRDASSGDTQALAPATEEQAAEAAAPQTGTEGAGEDEAMAEGAPDEEPLPAEQGDLPEDQVPITRIALSCAIETDSAQGGRIPISDSPSGSALSQPSGRGVAS